MVDEEKYELIEQYLEGKLVGAELLDFENQLEQDPGLADDVALHREVRDAIADDEEVALEAELRKIGQAYQGRTPGTAPIRKNVGQRRIFLIAASIALLAVAGWFAFSRFGPSPSPDQLFEAHFAPYQVPANIRGKVPESELQAALEPYKREDYDAAIVNLNQLEATYGVDEQVLFYRAVSELAVGKADSARLGFEQILAIPDNQSTVQAQWYLALSWLRLMKPENAEVYLRELSGYENKYRVPAADILDALD